MRYFDFSGDDRLAIPHPLRSRPRRQELFGQSTSDVFANSSTCARWPAVLMYRPPRAIISSNGVGYARVFGSSLQAHPTRAMRWMPPSVYSGLPSRSTVFRTT